MRLFLSFLLLIWSGISQALSSSGNRLLVVLDELTEKDNYSILFGDLESRGFTISYDTPKSDKLALFELGERAYDHLLILPSRSKGLGPNFTPANLLKFINAEGNVLLTLSASNPTPTAISSLLLELDIHLPSDRNALVVDHFNYDTRSSSEEHDVILVPRPENLRQDVRNFFSGKSQEVIAFPRGVGQILGNDSPLLAPILRAPRSAYSFNPKGEKEFVEEPFAVGSQLSLVSTMQARNSARFTVVGSAELLSDKWFDAKVKKSKGLQDSAADVGEKTTSNRAFSKEISGWTFKEIGVLKVFNIEHYLNEPAGVQPNETNPKIYRVKNDVIYNIEIGEWKWDRYAPFHPIAPIDELQLEFSMLSPFHRLNLAASPVSINRPNSTIFTTSFKLPDQHGIFNFKVNYKRPFLSNIQEKNTVSVRHFAHDEWPRSWVISNAWPWISGISVTVIGWVAFLAVWLWSAPVAGKGGLKKTQ